MKSENILEFDRISKTFGKGTVNESVLFRDFSLKIRKGDFVTVVGSNGSGKTTMLNIISNTVSLDGGRVLLSGEDITQKPEYKRAARIARVFQDPSFGTVGSMNILENMALAAGKGKRALLSFAVDKKRAQEYRELVSEVGLGLEDKMSVPVGLLSGGQRQALSLVMSTMVYPDLLLLDEHTAALDPRTADTVMEITDRIIRSRGISAIMVTHNLRYAVEYGNRIIMMHSGNVVLDRRDEEKRATSVEDLLGIFNAISIECGN